jgi:hypothetical protein
MLVLCPFFIRFEEVEKLIKKYFLFLVYLVFNLSNFNKKIVKNCKQTPKCDLVLFGHWSMREGFPKASFPWPRVMRVGPGSAAQRM